MFIDHKKIKNTCIFMWSKTIKQNQKFMLMMTNSQPIILIFFTFSHAPRGLKLFEIPSISRTLWMQKVDIDSAFIPFQIFVLFFQSLGQDTNPRHTLWKHWNFKRSPRSCQFFWGRQSNNNNTLHFNASTENSRNLLVSFTCLFTWDFWSKFKKNSNLWFYRG